jgi:hypothetical protein
LLAQARARCKQTKSRASADVVICQAPNQAMVMKFNNPKYELPRREQQLLTAFCALAG